MNYQRFKGVIGFVVFLTICSPWLLDRAHAVPQLQILHSFEKQPYNIGKVIQGDDGNLYGISYAGGGLNLGTVFKVTPEGVRSIIFSFLGGDLGNNPTSLLFGNDGCLYGTAQGGGGKYYGIVFKITTDGLYKVIFKFDRNHNNSTLSELVKASDGGFLDVNYDDGGRVSIYKISTSGKLSKVFDFKNNLIGSKVTAILQDRKGNIYGSVYTGPDTGNLIFKITSSGKYIKIGGYDVEYGGWAIGGFVADNAGNVYANIPGGGANKSGYILKIDSQDHLETVYNFSATGIHRPSGKMRMDADGILYGNAIQGNDQVVYEYMPGQGVRAAVTYSLSAGFTYLSYAEKLNDGSFYLSAKNNSLLWGEGIYRVSLDGSTQLITQFDYPLGYEPNFPLLYASDGNIYGSLDFCGANGYGALYRILRNGVFSIIHRGGDPNSLLNDNASGLVEGDDGYLYGNGDIASELFKGAGIYKMTKDGFISFAAALPYVPAQNGAVYNSYGSLLKSQNGDLYGAMSAGGSAHFGSVYKMDASGQVATLFEMDKTYGASPSRAIMEASDGSFYGTTPYGGINSSDGKGFGTIYKFSSTGKRLKTIPFQSTNGANPFCTLVEGDNGELFGTTCYGGSELYGTIFKMTPDGTITTLFTFNGKNGKYPNAGLVRGPNGTFYGIADGGLFNMGVLFNVTSSGVFSVVANFNYYNGAYPLQPLTLGDDGNLYGTTTQGGSDIEGHLAGGGVVFRLWLGPGLETLQASGLAYTRATVKALVNPGQYDTTASFLYGTDPNLTNYQTVPLHTVKASKKPVSVSASLSGLTPDTTYYYCISGGNAENPNQQTGEIKSFKTLGRSYNSAPVYSGLSINTKYQTSFKLNTSKVLAKAADPDKDALFFVSAGSPSHGKTQLSGNLIIYTPDAGFSGADSFVVTIEDALGATVEGWVSVTVKPK